MTTTKLATVHSLVSRRQELENFAKSLRSPFFHNWMRGTTCQFLVEFLKNLIRSFLSKIWKR